MRHQDFERIRQEFINYYKNEVKGNHEYQAWLCALKLDDTLCYAQTHESFQWAKDQFSLYKEDAENKYYRVLCAFPIKSMNGNVYHERDLIAAALNIKGGHPSINHNDKYWQEDIEIMGGKYEDGAVESIIKVPRSLRMPLSGYHEHVVDAIDKGDIVNVSLEGKNVSATGGFCFDEKTPFTLLTKDVLPGIPLARVFPIEAYLPFSQSQTVHRRQIKVIGIKKEMKKTKEEMNKELTTITSEITQLEVELANMANYNQQEIIRAKLNDLYTRKNALLTLSSPKAEAVDPVTGDSTTPILSPPEVHPKIVITTGTTAQGGSPCCITPDNTGEKHILGEAQMRVDLLKAESLIKGLELQKAEAEAKLQEAYEAQARLIGEKMAFKEQITRLEKQIDTNNKEQINSGTELKSLTRRLEDMTESRDQYKQTAETLKVEHEATLKKYGESLKTNIELEKKLTDTAEEYLQKAREANKAQEDLQKAKSIARKINVIGLQSKPA